VRARVHVHACACVYALGGRRVYWTTAGCAARRYGVSREARKQAIDRAQALRRCSVAVTEGGGIAPQVDFLDRMVSTHLRSRSFKSLTHATDFTQQLTTTYLNYISYRESVNWTHPDTYKTTCRSNCKPFEHMTTR
jgi:hypothetical protein